MRFLRLLTLCTTVGVAAPLPARAGPGAKVINEPYAAEFRARVRETILKGVEYLRTAQIEDPADPAPGSGDRAKRAPASVSRQQYQAAAAVVWVLRRAGLPAKDAGFARADRVLRARAPATADEVSLRILSLCTPSLPRGDPFAIDENAAAERPSSLPEESASNARDLVAWLLAQQAKGGSDYARGGWEDSVPTTCMAVLALQTAARAGVRVRAEPFSDAADFFLRAQAADGPEVRIRVNRVEGAYRTEWTEDGRARGIGWGVASGDAPNGYATAAGAYGLLLCADALTKDKTLLMDGLSSPRTGIRDALAWVQRNYDVLRVPGTEDDAQDPEGSFYYHAWLYCLSRLAIRSRMRYVGEHDWYYEGAEQLTRTQRRDGSWGLSWWRNCYAILFLLRSNVASIASDPSERR